MPKKMPWSSRFRFAWLILAGRFNVIGTVQTSLVYEVTLRNRNKEWYANRDAGRYPFLEPEDDEDGP